jgi:hypothetical protein
MTFDVDEEPLQVRLTESGNCRLSGEISGIVGRDGALLESACCRDIGVLGGEGKFKSLMTMPVSAADAADESANLTFLGAGLLPSKRRRS